MEEYIEQDSIAQAEIINDLMEQLWTDLKQARKKETYLTCQMIAKLLVDALGVDEMQPLMTAMAHEIVRVKELNKNRTYKNDGTEEIKCPKCGKGFPHGSIATQKGGLFYHRECLKEPKVGNKSSWVDDLLS